MFAPWPIPPLVAGRFREIVCAGASLRFSKKAPCSGSFVSASP